MQQGFHLTVAGQVQGVGYRHWFAEQARRLEITGYVKNLSDGQVEAKIYGEHRKLQQLLEQSMQGPIQAKVTKLLYQSLDDRPSDQFQIAYD